MTDALETTVQIESKTYAVGRLSAFDQMHLIADARSILTGLALLKRDRPKEMDDRSYLSTVGMITSSLGGLQPETRERIWNMCLGVVKQRGAVGFQPVLASAGQMQFADMDIHTITKLIYAVFEHNKLLDFFSEGLSGSDGPKTTESNGQGSMEEKTG
jgi:hypothetical protein